MGEAKAKAEAAATRWGGRTDGRRAGDGGGVGVGDAVAVADPSVQEIEPIYRDFRAGDVQHSLADISKANQLLGYQPTHRVPDGLAVAAPWYIQYWRDQR